ncbi:MAG: nickel pincer cofactor biosynthesis protein LarC [Methanomicrobiales archaeon]|nr:nickel pincer cofactor biosynthesis protein LarC [Methanomicrobiales archaeon]
MRILLLDPFRGAAGDMITAALIDAGADSELVLQAMRSVVPGIEVTPVERAGIRALMVRTHAHPTKRSLDGVLARVRSADAPNEAQEMATRIFQRIHRGEEHVHGRCSHFHEVGADDAIADVVGAATAFLSLHPDRVHLLPVPVGGGEITGSHGTIPAPGPATLAIFLEAKVQVRFGSWTDGEICTPTGAAILAEFAAFGGGGEVSGQILATGYGAGSREVAGVPNVFRAVLLEGTPDAQTDTVDILETNVDDISGEVLGHTLARCMEEGARDASAIPCIMKKGRGGYLVRVITTPDMSRALSALLAMELGTLGVRAIPSVHRLVAERQVREVTVEIGGEKRRVRVKCGVLGGLTYSLKAEFEDAKAWAASLNMPVREVATRIEQAARSELVQGGQGG